jgi:hypothetical protein
MEKPESISVFSNDERGAAKRKDCESRSHLLIKQKVVSRKDSRKAASSASSPLKRRAAHYGTKYFARSLKKIMHEIILRSKAKLRRSSQRKPPTEVRRTERFAH